MPPVQNPLPELRADIEDRVVAVYVVPADRAQHRAPSMPDLLLAATGGLADLTVLHDQMPTTPTSPSSVAASRVMSSTSEREDDRGMGAVSAA